MNIYTFWEGPMPPYVALCLKTRDRWWGSRHTVLNLSNLAEHLPGFPLCPYFMGLQRAHQADLIRTEIVANKGGCWVDADCIILDGMRDLLAPMAPNEFIYYNDGDTYANGFFAAGSRFNPCVREWAKLNRAVFLNHKRMGTDPARIPWRSFGSDQMKEILRNPLGPARDIGAHRIQPISWQHRSLFFDKFEDPKEQFLSVWRGAYAYMLYNNTFPQWFKDLTEEEILEGPWRISAIFRAALSQGD